MSTPNPLTTDAAYDGPPSRAPAGVRDRTAAVLWEVANRAAALALFAIVAAWALACFAKPMKWALVGSLATSDLGLVAAYACRRLAVDAAGRRRTLGLLWFCGIVFGMSLVLMLADRTGAIHDALGDFFTPSAVAR